MSKKLLRLIDSTRLVLPLLILWIASLKTEASPAALTQTSFELAMAESLKKVEEFEFAKTLAQKIGVRVYLFGGTASSFGHYVREFLTAPEPFRDLYDFDYTSIYRSTQDADLVIDGTPDQARQFELEMISRFDHLQGSKPVWEVRTLRESRNDNGAILDDFDFLNQHTDSNSVGLIELTDPPSHETRIRDVHHWNDAQNPFLESIRTGSIQFYFSETHEKTYRFRNRQNPPIFSVIRFLTKAFQHDLEISEADFKALQRIVADFEPAKDLSSSYARSWIEKNAKKMMLNSRNVERSWNLLERLNLRKKLIKIGEPNESGSMSWWLNKEPLRSFAVGQGIGASAAELGIEMIAHETRGQDSDDALSAFQAFESITASPTLSANVFISRPRVSEESAAFGEGFYTAIGNRGRGSSGFTIRFRLAPNAREGTDFNRFDDIIVVKNKNAIQVISERLRKSPLEYLETLNDLTFETNNLAVIHQFNRRVLSKAKHIDPKSLNDIFEFTRKNIRDSNISESALAWSLQILEKASSSDYVDKLLEEFKEKLIRSDFSLSRSYLLEKISKFFLERESFAHAHHLSSLYHHLIKDPQAILFWSNDLAKTIVFQLENNPEFNFTEDELSDMTANLRHNLSNGDPQSSLMSVLILMAYRKDEAIDEIFQLVFDQMKKTGEREKFEDLYLYVIFSKKISLAYTKYLKNLIPSSSKPFNQLLFENSVLPLHLKGASRNLIPFVRDLIFFQAPTGETRLNWKISNQILRTIEESKIAAPTGLISLLKWLSTNPKHSLRSEFFELDIKKEMEFRKNETLRRLNELEARSLESNEKISRLKQVCRKLLHMFNR